MTAVNAEQTYTVEQIRDAFSNVRVGIVADAGDPLNVLAAEMAPPEHVYRVGVDDLEVFLECHESGPRLTRRQRQVFTDSARGHIDKNEALGEVLLVCLTDAMQDALSA